MEMGGVRGLVIRVEVVARFKKKTGERGLKKSYWYGGGTPLVMGKKKKLKLTGERVQSGPKKLSRRMEENWHHTAYLRIPGGRVGNVVKN